MDQAGTDQTCYALTAENRKREWRGLLEAAEKLGVKAETVITVSEEDAETTQGVAISIQSAWRWLLQDPVGTTPIAGHPDADAVVTPNKEKGRPPVTARANSGD